METRLSALGLPDYQTLTSVLESLKEASSVIKCEEEEKVKTTVGDKGGGVRGKKDPNNRNRTSDRPIPANPLQSGALPTELCSDRC